jgi:hypothetical protein
LGVGLTTPPREKLYVKKPEAMPVGNGRHNKVGQGLKRAVVPQKKKREEEKKRRNACCVAGKALQV